MFCMQPPHRYGVPRTLLGVAAGLIASLAWQCIGAHQAHAGVPWHVDLAEAKAASLVSHRPVLVVFTAQWSEASTNLEKTSLASEEAIALVTACFEPLRLDVDAHTEITRRMGISHLPTACVIDLDERVLAKFDCPESSAGFVAAAGRAAQDASLAKGPAMPSGATNDAIAAVAAKVREQSDFATNAVAVSAPVPATATEVLATAAEPTLPAAPPAWPADTASHQSPFMADPATDPKAVPKNPSESLPGTPPSGLAKSPAHRPSVDPASTAAAPAQSTIANKPLGALLPWLGATGNSVGPVAKSDAASQGIASTASPVGASAVASTVDTATAAPNAAAPTGPTEKTTKPNAFLAALQKPFSIFTRTPSLGATPNAPATQALANQTAGATMTEQHGSMPVGLEGYCPVSLLDKGVWVEGRAQWGVRHRGRTYLFATAEQQTAFLADPDRYAPALSGDDPVLACDARKQVPGQRRYGVTYQSRMYLFSSPETRTSFAANPQRYTTSVHVAEIPSPTTDLRR